MKCFLGLAILFAPPAFLPISETLEIGELWDGSCGSFFCGPTENYSLVGGKRDVLIPSY